MLKKILWIIGAVVLFFSISAVYSLMTTRNHSPVETALYEDGELKISLEYCRPFKKGRTIFGGLLPYDTYWRTGANEPSIITFSQDVLFNGEKVNEGSYRIYTFPGEEQWMVALNTELEKWGYWEPDYSLDVLRTNVASINTKEMQEQFLISLEENNDVIALSMHWDQTKITVPIKKL